jgi:hypothetical protein
MEEYDGLDMKPGWGNKKHLRVLMGKYCDVTTLRGETR